MNPVSRSRSAATPAGSKTQDKNERRSCTDSRSTNVYGQTLGRKPAWRNAGLLRRKYERRLCEGQSTNTLIVLYTDRTYLATNSVLALTFAESAQNVAQSFICPRLVEIMSSTFHGSVPTCGSGERSLTTAADAARGSARISVLYLYWCSEYLMSRFKLHAELADVVAPARRAAVARSRLAMSSAWLRREAQRHVDLDAVAVSVWTSLDAFGVRCGQLHHNVACASWRTRALRAALPS